LASAVSHSVEQNRKNSKVIAKILEEISLYFATGTFTDSNMNQGALNSGGKLSTSMSSFFSILLQCKLTLCYLTVTNCMMMCSNTSGRGKSNEISTYILV
jgi:hypothetical protein